MKRPVLAGFLIAWMLFAFAAETPEESSKNLFRFGLTARMFQGINENDGRAAMKVYMETVLEERGLLLESLETFDDVRDVGNALRSGQLHAASVTAEEYLKISGDVVSVHLFDEPDRSDPGEEYLLLIHRSSPVTKLSGLKGGLLMEFDNLRNGLARMWLDVRVLEQGLPRTENLFEKVTLESKLSKVVLPVFFGNAQACLVTRRGFETMVELNPQVGKNLRVLDSSPAFVATVTCFGAKANLADRTAIVQGIQRLHEQPRGRQLLTVFQGGDRLAEYPASFLDRVKRLKSRHDELLKKTSIEPAEQRRAKPAEGGK